MEKFSGARRAQRATVVSKLCPTIDADTFGQSSVELSMKLSAYGFGVAGKLGASLSSQAVEEKSVKFSVLRSGVQKSRNTNRFHLRTQKAHKHKHFIGISLPYWAS